MIKESVLLVSLAAVASFASSTLRAETAPPPAPAAKAKAPVYVPPNRGAPASRVGGGSRGAGDEETMLRVLAPEHTGLASSDQPALFWYISKPAQTRLEVALIDDTAEEPLLELAMAASAPAGIQSLKLREHGIHLKPNVEYQWSVALVIDPDQRSRDVLASGTIMHVPATQALEASVATARPEERPSLYAAAGYWYDAVDSLSALIATSPNTPDLVAQRAGLLEQVGLSDVASAPTP